MLVFVDQSNKLDHRGAPDTANVMLNQVQQYLVQVLGEQIPQNLIVNGAIGTEGLVYVWYFRDVEDIPHQQEAVVDQIDLDVAHLLLTDESLHPIHDYVGGSRVSERFFCPHQTGGQLKLSLSSLICLEIVHGAQTFNGNGQVHQQSNDGIKDLHVVSSIEEDRNQIFLENLKQYIY